MHSSNADDEDGRAPTTRMTDQPHLHVEAEGQGPVVLLGHGFGGSARNFRAQSRALAAKALVVRFDARGHARSDAPLEATAYTPGAFVADVERILDARDARTAVVGGLSMGAGIALRFALAHPERTRALVLAAFPAAADRAGSYASVAERFAARIDRDGLEAAGAEFVWGADSGFDAEGAALVRRGFLEHQPHAMAHILRGVIAVQPSVAELAPVVAAVRIPTLVVVGARDRLSLDACRALARALPNAELVEIPDAGHLVNLARPSEFNAAVSTFLDAVPPD
jgi:pimeloyl-ACP methyl ester carboxylesterase